MAGSASVDLAYQAIGTGPPLLVLHGLFGSGTNWRGIARRLAAGHRVVLVDLRNHGVSPHTPLMDYPAMAADVRALLDRLGLPQAALLGHSMGGKTAMTLALETPQRVARLVVVDIAPVTSPGDHGPLIDAMRTIDPGRMTRRAQADQALAPAIPDATLRAFLLQNLVAAGGGYRWRIDLDAIAASMPALLGFPDPGRRHFEGPALFVRGARSRYVCDTDYERIAKLFPAARVVSIAGAGHWVHAERPEALLETVTAFLAGTPGA